MSLDVIVYTYSQTGQREVVRGIDWKLVMKDWSVRKLSKEEHTRELLQLFKDTEKWRTLAGPEDWRIDVYGSQQAKALGLTLLPSLSEGNLDLRGAELDRLAWEIEKLIENVALFATVRRPIIDQASETPQSDGMLFRFQNIANAVLEAKQLGGGVEIS